MPHTDNSKSMPADQLLNWYLSMGVDETIGEEPQNLLQKIKKTEKSIPVKTESPKNLQTKPGENIKPAISPNETIQKAQELATQVTSLENLRKVIDEFEGLSCKKTAHSTVFGDGDPNSDLMIVTDVPNAEEDREGLPFMGEVGDLFNKMMEAIAKDRKKDFYIASLLPWRVLGNRKPNENETATCLPFLMKHIELVAPKTLVLMGTIPCQSILQNKQAINKIRGNWQTIEVAGKTIDVMPTFHPSYLLRQPNAKRDSWCDLLEIKKKLENI